MGMIRTLGAVTVTAGTPTPVLKPILSIVAAVSFSITNNIATINLGAGNLPANGYNGPNGFPTQNATTGAAFDIFGGVNRPTGQAGGGQQVILWGFGTGTYFNGKVVTVLDCNPTAGTFRFAFTHANVASTNDAGNTAPVPFQHYRTVRIEAGQSNGTDLVYVGDSNVSSSQYTTALSLAGIRAIDISSDNIPAARIFIDGTSNSDTAQISIIY